MISKFNVRKRQSIPPLKARQNTWGKKWTKTNMSRLSVQQSCPISKINDTRAIIDCAIQAQIFPYHHNEFFHISTKWLQMSTLLNQYWSSYTCYRVVEWFCRWRFNVSPKQLEWMCVCSMEGIFLLCIGHQTLTQHRKAKSKHGIALRLTMYTSYGIFYVTLRTGFGTRTFIKTAWL